MMKIAIVGLTLLLGSYSACADPVFSFSFKFKTPGGDGFVASYFAKTEKEIIYSNVGVANFRPGSTRFSSIKLPLKGGHGCSKRVKNNFVGNDGAEMVNINSTCVTIETEDENVYYIKETQSTELGDGAIVHNFVAFHLFVNGNSCTTNADMIWRTFRNSGDVRVQATSVDKTCQQARF